MLVQLLTDIQAGRQAADKRTEMDRHTDHNKGIKKEPETERERERDLVLFRAPSLRARPARPGQQC